MKNNNFKVELIIIDILNYKDFKNIEELTQEQKTRIIKQLEEITNNVKEYNCLYSSDYLSLIMLLSDIKYYQDKNDIPLF